MNRSAALAAGIVLLTGASLADAQPRRGGIAGANPSAIVAAELGFARLAQEKGQWTAFRETADKDAVMFVPEAVNAQDWLRKRADPPTAIAWQPYRVFVSCDGGYALSTGPWTRPDGTSGTFSTIWRRQKKGDYKWVLDFGSSTRIAPQDEVVIEGKIARCAGRGAQGGPDGRMDDDRPPQDARGKHGTRDEGRRTGKQAIALIPNPPPPSGEGQSDDGSLRWRWTKGERENRLVVIMREGGGERTVLDEATLAGAP